MTTSRVGAALVVGGGIGGMQAALDLAAAGIKVYLVESKASIGGAMAQLDKTFPTNDCAMCTMAPRLVETSRNKDIEVITLSEVEAVEGAAGDFSVTVRKRARYVDEVKCTGCGECVQVCPIKIPDEFNRNLKETTAIYRRYPQAVPNTFAIEKLGHAPCRFACPADQKAQGYIALIREKRYEDAYRVILRDNPLPSVCGRVCKHYCEDDCTRGRIDEPVSIMKLKRFVADWAYEKKLGRREIREAEEGTGGRGKRVAVIGSGPAGITAARDLDDMGHSVTVFEGMSEPGGMMRFGVPEFKLPRERLQWDIRNALTGRIRLETNRRIESLDRLLDEGFEAIFVATGAHRSKRLPVPGSDLPGVLMGTDFLRSVATDVPPVVGRRVLVVGGGNVAMDVARVSVRLGAEDVTLVCLESRDEMPADPWEVEDAEQEGVSILPSRSLVRVTSENGRVSGATCVKAHLRGFDEDGRPEIDVVTDSEHSIGAETVIIAIGQTAELPFAGEGLELTRSGTVNADPETLATSRPGIFAGGEAVTGAKFIVDAIAAGHRAASSIQQYLRGERLRAPEAAASKVELTDEKIRIKVRSGANRHSTPRVSAVERKSTFAEYQQGYSEESALEEADRCLECGICSECLLCEEICEAKAVKHSMPREERIVLQVGAIVLAPGYELFDAASKETLGYGRFPNVLNALEFERTLSPSGPSSGNVVRPSDEKTPRRIAFIQCVGSRDSERDYCSSVCCMYATKEAVIAKEHAGQDLECDVFFMDLRAFGKGFEEYYQRARTLGVNYIRCRPASVEEIPETRNLIVKFLTEEEKKVSREYDLVVLSVGMCPPRSAGRIAASLGLELNEFGFCRTSTLAPVESTRPGIYVAGPFSEPKDIPETVMQASGAAAKAMSLLEDVKGSLIVAKEYPPETDVRGSDPRIGVFVCHCGTNIASVVDVEDVVAFAKTLPQVVHAENRLYTCSNDTQELMKETIRANELNRVIVAACTPRTHEPLFRDTIREAALNPYLFEMANIRDQCSWVHRDTPAEATRKAKDLVAMAVAKARMLEPLRRRTLPVEKSALVIGGGLSGMTSALELASQGFPVYLVEREKELGGNLRHLQYLLDSTDPQDHLRQLIERLRTEEGVEIFTETMVEQVEGSIGNFKTTITGNGQSRELHHGVVVVATGAREYRPQEYLYGEDERVVTQLELEQRLAASGEWRRTGNGERRQSVVMIQCVGSREKERPYCSRLCCAEAIKNALKIKEISPETSVYFLHRDVRVYGFREAYYTEARRRGVVFIRYKEALKPQVRRNGKGLEVEVVDQTLGMPITIPADFVALSAGVVPNDGCDAVAQLLKVPLTRDRFFLEAHMKLRPVDFATEGVFLCGLAHSAKAVEEGIIQAEAAAARAAAVLSKDCVELEANISEVVDEKCDGCAYCIDPCPFKAITIIEYMSSGATRKTVEVNETACKGCGSCQASCPKEGIIVRGFNLAQIEAQVGAAWGEE
jgi:heterodisulfide reductase subunit A-like polyferredoxin